MNKSESINEIMTALSKAQGTFSAAKKDCANPYFKSKYADLASVLEACKEGLAANGLAVSQLLGMEGDKAALTTLLGHSSGQWISSTIALPITKPGAQEVGSCITYLRRYSLVSLLNLAQDDDDGEAAVKQHREAPKPYKELKPESRILTEEQCEKLEQYISEFPGSAEWLLTKYGIKSVYGLQQEHFEGVCSAFEKKRKLKGEAVNE